MTMERRHVKNNTFSCTAVAREYIDVGSELSCKRFILVLDTSCIGKFRNKTHIGTRSRTGGGRKKREQGPDWRQPSSVILYPLRFSERSASFAPF